VDGADDLAAVDALEVDARDTEVGVPELALDHDQRHAVVRHLNRMSVPELVWREPAPYPGFNGRAMQLLGRGGCFPPTARSRSMDHTEQRPDPQLTTDLEPRIKLVPRPAVHPNLATLAALPAPNEHGAPAAIKIALMEGERFVDSQAGTPQQHDQCTEAMAVGATTECTHDRDDLLNCRRISRILLALVPWWAASVVARHRCGRAAVAGGVQQH
jgi:hypothetical protein